jgi:hypothetical protein
MPMELNAEEFEILYSAPFKIDGKNLEYVEDLFDFYREKMTNCRNVREMQEVCENFGFLAEDAVEVLEHVENWQLPQIKQFWRDDAVLDLEEEELFAPLIFPVTMFMARTISKHEMCPQYYAAFNYVWNAMYGTIH